jgi:hypothetical protein
MALSHSPQIVRDNLVLYLDAANIKSYPGSGITFFDLSINKNNATLLNGVAYSANNLGSLIFDGVDDFININQPAIQFSPNKWTVCFWIKPNNQTSRFLTPNSNGIDQYLTYNSTLQRIDVSVAQSADVNERTRAGTSNTIPIGVWSYFCISIDNLNIKIYANSILTNEYTETISIGNWSGAWRLGQRGNNTSWYSGEFSNFLVYNRQLSTQEIKQNFEALRRRYGI